MVNFTAGDLFVQKYQRDAQTSGQRLGQYFCNCYIVGNWPELYYEKEEWQAKLMIEDWLANNHYFDSLPQPVVSAWKG